MRHPISTFAFAAAITASAGPAASQSSQSATLSVASGQQLRLGYYSIFKKDCSAGPVPEIRISSPPKHGSLTLQIGTLATKRLQNCPEAKAPVQVVFYRSSPGYSGPDSVAFDVVNILTRQTQSHSIAITVVGSTRPN